MKREVGGSFISAPLVLFNYLLEEDRTRGPHGVQKSEKRNGEEYMCLLMLSSYKIQSCFKQQGGGTPTEKFKRRESNMK